MPSASRRPLGAVSGNRPLASPPTNKKKNPVVVPTIGPDNSPSSSIGSARRDARSPGHDVLVSPFFMSPPATQLHHSGLTPALAQLNLNGTTSSPMPPSPLRQSDDTFAAAGVPFGSVEERQRRLALSPVALRIGFAAAGTILLVSACWMSMGSSAPPPVPVPHMEAATLASATPKRAATSQAFEQEAEAAAGAATWEVDASTPMMADGVIDLAPAPLLPDAPMEEDMEDANEQGSEVEEQPQAEDKEAPEVPEAAATAKANTSSTAAMVNVDVIASSVRAKLLATAKQAVSRAVAARPTHAWPHNDSFYVCEMRQAPSADPPSLSLEPPTYKVVNATDAADDHTAGFEPLPSLPFSTPPAPRFVFMPTDRYTGPPLRPQHPRMMPTCGLAPLPWTNASIYAERALAAKEAAASFSAAAAAAAAYCTAPTSVADPSHAVDPSNAAHAADASNLIALEVEFEPDELYAAEAAVESSSLAPYYDDEDGPCASTDLGPELMLGMLVEHQMMLAVQATKALAAPAASLSDLAAMAHHGSSSPFPSSSTVAEAGANAAGRGPATAFVLLGDSVSAPPMTLLPVDAFRPASPLFLALIRHPTANQRNKRAAKAGRASPEAVAPATCPMDGASPSTALIHLPGRQGKGFSRLHATMTMRLRLPAPSDIGVLQPATAQNEDGAAAHSLAVVLAPIHPSTHDSSPTEPPLAVRAWAELVAWSEWLWRSGAGAWQYGTDDAIGYLRTGREVSMQMATAAAESATEFAAATAEQGFALRQQLAEGSSDLATSTLELIRATGVDAQIEHELAQLHARLPALDALRQSLQYSLNQLLHGGHSHPSAGDGGADAAEVEAPPLHLWFVTLASAVLAALALLHESQGAERAAASLSEGCAEGSPSRPPSAQAQAPPDAPPFTPLSHILQPWMGTASTLAPSPEAAPLSGVTVSSVSYTSDKPWRQQPGGGSSGGASGDSEAGLASVASSLSVVSEATHAMAAEARALLDAAVDEGFDHDINPLVLFDIVEPCEPPPPLSASKSLGARRASRRIASTHEAQPAQLAQPALQGPPAAAAADAPVRRSRRIVQKKGVA